MREEERFTSTLVAVTVRGCDRGGLRVCKDGERSYRGQGKGFHAYIYVYIYVYIYIYISRYGRCCNALSDVSTTKLPLVKLPVDDTLDLVFLSETSVSLHFTGGEGELFTFYEDCQ